MTAAQMFSTLRRTYGPTSEAGPGLYFYKLAADPTPILGTGFCKVAAAFRRDPWELGQEVVDHLDMWKQKLASPGIEGELAKFYVEWADELEKNAISLAGIGAGAKAMWTGAKGVAAKAVEGAKYHASRAATAMKDNLKASRAARGGVVRQPAIPDPVAPGATRTMNPVGNAGQAGTTAVPAAKRTGRSATRGAPKPGAAGAPKPEFKDTSNIVHKAIGTGVLGAGGLAAMNMMGGGGQGGY